MKIRNVLKEFEAHIYPVPPDGTTQGKSEWKHYGDGSYRYKIYLRNIPLADDSNIAVILDDTELVEITVRNRMAKIDSEDNPDIGIPHVKAGQRLQIKAGGLLLAEGQYIEE